MTATGPRCSHLIVRAVVEAVRYLLLILCWRRTVALDLDEMLEQKMAFFVASGEQARGRQ